MSTQETKNAFDYVESIITKEKIDVIVIGIPKHLNNEPAEMVPQIINFKNRIQNKYPAIKIVEMDERFTSKMAFQTMIDSGLKKSDRKNKAMVDEIAATIILQNYLSTF